VEKEEEEGKVLLADELNEGLLFYCFNFFIVIFFKDYRFYYYCFFPLGNYYLFNLIVFF
jgi:hypothetical protein